MPTARELLEQADALMRRNRGREYEPDIPELTDEIAIAEPRLPIREQAKLRSALRGRQEPQEAQGRQAPQERGDDVPVLNDAVEELSLEPLPDEEDVSRWLETDMGEASITGPAPDSIAVVPPSTLRPAATASAAPSPARVMGTLSGTPAEPPPASDPGFDAMLGMAPAEAAFEQELAPSERVTPPSAVAPEVAAPAEAPAAAVPDAQRWEGLAEEIRMQVLQRIDIFTDTGLHGELAARLQPIVDRASVDLVTTINREVGQILRAYVAEAIEREIEKWRQANP